MAGTLELGLFGMRSTSESGGVGRGIRRVRCVSTGTRVGGMARGGDLGTRGPSFYGDRVRSPGSRRGVGRGGRGGRVAAVAMGMAKVVYKRYRTRIAGTMGRMFKIRSMISSRRGKAAIVRTPRGLSRSGVHRIVGRTNCRMANVARRWGAGEKFCKGPRPSAAWGAYPLWEGVSRRVQERVRKVAT